jgi:hypothetical protein
MTTPDPGEAFVRLGLAIDQHLPGYVDAYFGPMAHSQAARRRGKAALPELTAEAQALAAAVARDEGLDPLRREWLLGEIGAMQTTLRLLSGEQLEILTEVRLLYGVTPAWIDEQVFADARRALDSILPGTGPVFERGLEFRRRMRVSLERIRPAMMRLVDDLRRRTRQRYPLPAEETCEFASVSDKPWLAYNGYKGAGRSRIDINSDRPLYLHQIPEIMAHETYPGHHTEQTIKDQHLFQDQGWVEQSIALSNSPTCLVSEGVATNALEAVADAAEMVGYYADLLSAAGLPAEEAQRVADFVRAGSPLDLIAGNQILLLHGEKLSAEEVVAYGVRYGMATESEQRDLLRFMQDPLWRSYGFNYTVGRDLVRSYLSASADRVAAFTRLLTEPMTPRQLDLVAGT